MSTILKKKQIEHMDNAFKNLNPALFEGNLYHDYFRAIPFQKLKTFLDRCNINLDNQKVLVASCGNGIDLHYLEKFYKKIDFFVSDISPNAVTTVLKTFHNIDGRVEDNESLSFQDNTFDYVFIAAALHHLPRPALGLYELLRVSKKGLIAIEPNDTWLTRLATKLKLATEIEKCGNYVYRFCKRDVEKISKALFCLFSIKRCFATHRIAKHPFEFWILKILNGLSNLVFPNLGNYIIFVIQKKDYRENK